MTHHQELIIAKLSQIRQKGQCLEEFSQHVIENGLELIIVPNQLFALTPRSKFIALGGEVYNSVMHVVIK